MVDKHLGSDYPFFSTLFCLSVSRITQKLVDQFLRKLAGTDRAPKEEQSISFWDQAKSNKFNSSSANILDNG